MEDRRKEMIRKMLMTPDLEKSREALAQDPENPELLYQLGMAVGVAQGAEASIDTFRGGWPCILSMLPCTSAGGASTSACASTGSPLPMLRWPFAWSRTSGPTGTTVPCRATLAGDARGALEDFMQCYRMTPENEHYPLVDWMFLCCLDMGDMDRAAETLKLIDTSVEPHHCMDYAYRRRIRLYKGEIKPEEMIDDEDILKKCVRRSARTGTAGARNAHLRLVRLLHLHRGYAKGQRDLEDHCLLQAVRRLWVSQGNRYRPQTRSDIK